MKFLWLTLVVTLGMFWCTGVEASNYGSGLYGNSVYGQATDYKPNTQASPEECTKSKPGGKTPWLYGAIPTSTSVKLYFTGADGSVDHYVIEYGNKSGEYIYAADPVGDKDTRVYEVKSLARGKQYFFRVRAGNGCAVGGWSNELSATTGATSGLSVNDKQLQMTVELVPQVEVTPTPTPTLAANRPVFLTPPPTPVQTTGGYEVQIDVLNMENKPVAGAQVTLHSTPRTTKTDANGKAKFENVEEGEHSVQIAYNGFTGEQNVFVTGEVKTIELKIMITQKDTLFAKYGPIIVGGMGLIVLLLLVLLIRSKKHG